MGPIQPHPTRTEVRAGEQSQGKLCAGEQDWLQESQTLREFDIVSASQTSPPQGLCSSLLGNT